MKCIGSIDQYLFAVDYSRVATLSYNLYKRTYNIVVTSSFVVVTFCLVFSLVLKQPSSLELLFLGEWVLIATFLYFAQCVGMLVMQNLNKRVIYNVAWKIKTILFLLSFTNSLLSNALQWCIVYLYGQNQISVLNGIVSCTIPCVLLCIDFAVNAVAVDTWRHLCYIYIFDSLYFAFNLIYSLAENPIYLIINYTNIDTYVILICAFILLTLQYWLIKHVYRRLKEQKILQMLPETLYTESD